MLVKENSRIYFKGATHLLLKGTEYSSDSEIVKANPALFESKKVVVEELLVEEPVEVIEELLVEEPVAPVEVIEELLKTKKK